MQTLVESHINGRLGEYRVRIYDDRADPVSSKTTLPILGDVVIRYGEQRQGVGSNVLRSIAELTFVDEQQTLEDTFGGAFDESNFPVEIVSTADDAFSWYGYVAQGERKRRVNQSIVRGTTPLTLFDGLKLADDKGPAQNQTSGFERESTKVGRVLGKLSGLHPDVEVRAWWVREFDHINDAPVGYTEDNSLRLPDRAERISDESPLSAESLKDQMKYLAEITDGRLFLSTSLGHYQLIPRLKIGESHSPLVVDGYSSSFSTESEPARTTTLTTRDVNDQEGAIQDQFPAGLIEVPVGADYNLIHGGTGVTGDVGDPTSDLDPAGPTAIELAPNWSSGDDDEFAEFNVGTLKPRNDKPVKPRLTWEYDSKRSGSDSTLEVSLTVNPTGGSSSTTSVSGSNAKTTDGALKGAEFTGEAEIIARFEGHQTRVNFIQLRLISEQANEVVSQFKIKTSSPGTNGVRIEPIPMPVIVIDADNDGIVEPTTARDILVNQTSTTYSFRQPFDARRVVRAALQPGGTKTIQTEVWGLHGPETAVTIPIDDNDKTFICGAGRTLHLKKGMTELSDIEK